MDPYFAWRMLSAGFSRYTINSFCLQMALAWVNRDFEYLALVNDYLLRITEHAERMRSFNQSPDVQELNTYG